MFRNTSALVGALFVLGIAQPSFAQERPAPRADLAIAWYGFADDGIVSEAGVAGAIQWYVLPRVSVGPELIYISGQNHSHVVATGNLTWDVRSHKHGRLPAFMPFLVIGGGLFRTNESLFVGRYSSSEGAFTAGGGVRATISDRVTLGMDARIGWEPHIRINGVVGVALGRD